MNNVATTAAGVSTYAAVQAFEPDFVVSAGTAGGFSEKGAAVGDVYLSTKCVFHSRRIPEGDNQFEEYGFGHYRWAHDPSLPAPASRRLTPLPFPRCSTRSPALGALAAEAGLKQGVVSTSDSLDCTEMDLTLMRSEGAVVKEMEVRLAA